MRFRATIQLNGKTATGIPVPAKVVAELGKGKRPPVQVTIGEHTYRSTVAAYGDVFMLLQRWHVESIEGAKATETRQRRIDKSVSLLREGKAR